MKLILQRLLTSPISILNPLELSLLNSISLDSVSRPVLASSTPEIEHQVQQFIPLLFTVAMKMCAIQ